MNVAIEAIAADAVATQGAGIARQALNAIPNFFEAVGNKVQSPQGAAIFAGALVCYLGVFAVGLAAYQAAPLVSRASRAVYNRTRDLIQKQNGDGTSLEGEVIAPEEPVHVN